MTTGHGNGSLSVPMESNLLQKRRAEEAFGTEDSSTSSTYMTGAGMTRGAATSQSSSQSIASSEGDDR